MTDERITKINKIGKIAKTISTIILVSTIIAAVLTAGVSIAAFCVPNDIAKININGTAQIDISEKYLEIGKHIISEVNEGMTEEGQKIDIAGNEYEYISADVDGDKINISYKSTDREIGVRDFGVFTIGVFIETVNTLVLLIFVVALCKAIEKCQTPFEENIIIKMKKLAIAIIPWLIINGFAGGISSYAFTNEFEFSSSIISLGSVIIALIFIVLIYVFKYGVDLQKQSDETL